MDAIEQRNSYKGHPLRSWIRICLTSRDGYTNEVQLLADTGNPCAIIIGRQLMKRMQQRTSADTESNFGLLEGGWLHLTVPELGLNQFLEGFASDAVVAAAKASSPDFEGLVGLPFLRLTEYGGNASDFWIRTQF